jgi:phosphate transport system substrate-binding protein
MHVRRTRLTTALLTLALSACTRHEPRGGAAGESGHTSGQSDRGTSAGPAGGTVTLKGSDTMVILSQRWAEVFMHDHAGFTIQVTGGGSGTGIAALINGTTDVADSSRPMKDEEKSQVQSQRHAAANEIKVAVDALAVYVPESNPLHEISIPQLKRIFTGQVTNWKDVGGPDAPIVLYGRENNSGTYVYFKEHVLGDADYAASTQTLPGTAAVINAVARDPHGIGYGGIAYAQGVRPLHIKPTDDAPAVEPSMTTATNGTYPLSRFLFFYTAGEPTGAARTFIDWVLSPAGQAVIENVGYYPLPRPGSATTATPAPTGG